VYIPANYPLFDEYRTPNFSLLLSILKFFQHHLDHIQQHLGFATRQAMSWDWSGTSSIEAFQPGPHVRKGDFDDNPSQLEGDWIGLYSYLGWADFEALRDGNPDVLEANQSGQLRDYLGGPQQLTIRVPKDGDCYMTKETSDGKISIEITGEGSHNGPFVFRGRLRRIYLPGSLFGGEDRYLYWRITFVKTYATGENSWTRWIYDGIFVPGMTRAPFFKANRQEPGSLDGGEMELICPEGASRVHFGCGEKACRIKWMMRSIRMILTVSGLTQTRKVTRNNNQSLGKYIIVSVSAGARIWLLIDHCIQGRWMGLSAFQLINIGDWALFMAAMAFQRQPNFSMLFHFTHFPSPRQSRCTRSLHSLNPNNGPQSSISAPSTVLFQTMPLQ
jgi:hypothetical protein